MLNLQPYLSYAATRKYFLRVQNILLNISTSFDTILMLIFSKFEESNFFLHEKEFLKNVNLFLNQCIHMLCSGKTRNFQKSF